MGYASRNGSKERSCPHDYSGMLRWVLQARGMRDCANPARAIRGLKGTVVRVDGELIKILYWDTAVVTLHPDGSVTLNAAGEHKQTGWLGGRTSSTELKSNRSMTTKARMNEWLPAPYEVISTRDGWKLATGYLSWEEDRAEYGPLVMGYQDGMRIDVAGKRVFYLGAGKREAIPLKGRPMYRHRTPAMKQATEMKKLEAELRRDKAYERLPLKQYLAPLKRLEVL